MKEGWEMKKLVAVCDFFNDGNWIESKDQSEKGYRLIQTGNVGIGEFKNKSGKERYVSEETFRKLNCTEIFEGDILVSRLPDPVGRTCIVPPLGKKMITAVDCSIIRLKKGILINDYFKYYSQSQSYFKSVSERITGTTRDRISRSNLGVVPIPVPPVIEQKAIVSILDETFAVIEQAKENIQRNLKNTEELFQSELNSVFTNKTDGWVQRKLNEISVNLDSKRIPITKEIRSSGKYPYYGASGIVDYVGEYIFDENLLLVSEDGANLLARTYPIAFSIRGKTWVNNHAHVLKFQNEVSQKFVEYYLNSIKLNDFVSGMAQPKLNQTMLNTIPIPYPSLFTQTKITHQLDVLSIETKKLEKMYRQKLEKLDALKKSILQKAFSGKLTNKIEIDQQVKIAVTVPYCSEIELHAGLIALALKRHEEANAAKTFHHVKSEKIIHLIEYHLAIDLGRNPVKDAAGPNDYPLKLRVEREAKEADYFSVETVRGIKNYIKGDQFDPLVSKVTNSLQNQLSEVDKLIKLMIPLFTKEAEIVATLYAAWNNLLLDELETTDETIVFEARENWHENKLKIPRERFFKAISWMKDNNLVPKGTGKKVLNKQAAN